MNGDVVREGDGNANALPFGFVKKEFEPVGLTGVATDEKILQTLGTLTAVPIESIPKSIVEVVIPAHKNSLEAYRASSDILIPEFLDVETIDVDQLGNLVQPEDMKNENAKVKKETFRLAESTITKYINFFDLRSFRVPQDPNSQLDMSQTIRREFLSNRYGGCVQELLSIPAAGKAAKHGHRIFVCPMISIHPWAPQMPGQPGLIFDCPPKSNDKPWIDEKLFPCIAGLRPGKWLYTGHYKWRGHGWLTKEEWKDLPPHVKRNWIAYIMHHPWGIPLRMSIRLRRTLRRDPTLREVEKKSAAFEKKGKLDDVTSQEIMDAFDRGHERMRVSGLICDHYDIDLQREFIRKQTEWYDEGAPGMSRGKETIRPSKKMRETKRTDGRLTRKKNDDRKGSSKRRTNIGLKKGAKF